MNKKSLIWPVLALLLVVGGLAATGMITRWRYVQRHVQSSRALQVVATIYPLAEFSKQVGGDLVEVVTITPPGVEPHDYEPTPQDLVKMYKADVVVINGNGVDAWADKLVEPLRAKKIDVVYMKEKTGVESLPEDPHFWLDPVAAKQAVEYIGEAIALDSPHVLRFMRQKDAYTAKLDTLDQAYRTGLANCARREIVTSHDAFRYLAKEYQLTNLFISGISPEDDPSPSKIAEVATLAKEKGIKTIFFETLVSPRLAQTIAAEIGAKTAVLNPIEGLTEDEVKQGKDYLSVMQENLTQLREALDCT